LQITKRKKHEERLTAPGEGDACTHWQVTQAKAPSPMLEMAATSNLISPCWKSQITKRKKHEVQRLTAPGEGAFSCGQSRTTIERHFFFAGRR
jgi:hypothetical protein